jgi:magnesium chelatase family protein
MFARVTTVGFEGIEARAVDVQVQIGPGLPAFTIVGLPDKAVAESRERVRGALNAIGLALPPKRITVNLAPADLPKEGSHYDLPIALGLMAAVGAVAHDAIEGYCVLGELALDGSIAAVAGALPAAIGANALGKGLVCPQISGAEAAWAAAEMSIRAPSNLVQLVNHFKGLQTLGRPQPTPDPGDEAMPDLKDIKGQETAKRALEVAAAGGHNPATARACRDARGEHDQKPRRGPRRRAHRQDAAVPQPRHSASMAALVGGGTRPRPGEVALAHLGVLFLDELPEFHPQVLDALRQPLESGETVIARANHRISYPCRVQLVAAMNPCRCGRAGEPSFACRQGRGCAERYQARISGPLLDRIDLQIEVPAVSAANLVLPAASEGSAEVRARVAAATPHSDGTARGGRCALAQRPRLSSDTSRCPHARRS